MPRTPRVDAPGTAHHIMVRGIERRAIFRDDRDREDWLERLDRILPESRARCFAWSLMTNHVHLVVQSGPVSISRVMARLGTGYALRFNTRHDRHGHLFQNRFKSRIVASDADLMQLIRYVHRNPLAAGIVPDLGALERSAWSGHAALCGLAPPRPFQDPGAALALFGRHPAAARAALRRFMLDEAPETETATRLVPHCRAPDEGPARAPTATSLAPPKPADPRGTDPHVGVWSDLLRHISRAHGVPAQQLIGPSKRRAVVRARTALCTRAVRELGLTQSQVALQLSISPTSVSRALERARCRSAHSG